MNKIDIVKKIGSAALKLSGLKGGDEVRALKAEKELLELKVALLTQALEPFAAHDEEVRLILSQIR